MGHKTVTPAVSRIWYTHIAVCVACNAVHHSRRQQSLTMRHAASRLSLQQQQKQWMFNGHCALLMMPQIDACQLNDSCCYRLFCVSIQKHFFRLHREFNENLIVCHSHVCTPLHGELLCVCMCVWIVLTLCMDVLVPRRNVRRSLLRGVTARTCCIVATKQ